MASFYVDARCYLVHDEGQCFQLVYETKMSYDFALALKRMYMRLLELYVHIF